MRAAAGGLHFAARERANALTSAPVTAILPPLIEKPEAGVV
ncbi:hypothetical protein GL267_000695 [Acidithiobacillus ferrianus]|uniref:Uncharacterized protein n=1 Tax=Acidithiobacillus ferrianus TaxID=2678518 RepID=A0ACD5H884_9PROT|nr:hypothetical protein [Acidithiobacillus ferrianus]